MPLKKTSANGIIKGGVIIALGGLISKVLGAFYRIPLTNILGGEGLGIYQTAFPIYCLLLTFSSTGAPSAIAKLVASDNDKGKAVLRRALTVFAPLGLFGSLFMAVLSPVISRLQGNPDAYAVYIALSPSVFLVSVISCVRGYFQGKKNMSPTAVSQVIEQAVKLSVGLFLCYYFANTPKRGATFATLAVSISEGVALLYLLLLKKKDKREERPYRYSARIIVANVIPIAFSTLLLPLARVYDSFTVINYLKSYMTNAVSLYGVYTGGVETVIGLPVSVCYGLAVASLPTVSALVGKGETEKAHEKASFSIGLTLLVSSVFAFIIFFFSGFIVNTVFKGLSQSERLITSSLLKSSAVNVILLSLVQTETSCLIALGKNYAPCVFLGFGLLAKIIIQPILLSVRSVNIFAPLISDILCYSLAVFGNLVYIIICKGKVNENNAYRNRNNGRRFISRGV